MKITIDRGRQQRRPAMRGVLRAVKILRLDYSKLKRMMEAAVPLRVTMAPARFVELTTYEGIAITECVIELERLHNKIRFH